MAPAAAGMTHAWKHGVSAQAPRAPIVSNLDAGLITTPDRLIRDIVASISAPVQWSSALELMRNKGVKRFIFVGPGKALANLARKEVKTGNWRQEEGGLQIGTVATEKCMLETSRMCEDLVHQLEGQQDVTKGMTAEARA
jgi:acyl transferase domain-containing protein